MNRDEAWVTAGKHLGFNGAMISASKSGYKAKGDLPVVFNANVCTKEYGKIWYGDLDINESSKHLFDLTDELGVAVYVLREMDARFENEGNPKFDKAVFTVTPE